MTEHTLVTLDTRTGRVIVDSEQPGAAMTEDRLRLALGTPGDNVGCARPLEVLAFPHEPPPPLTQRIRVSGYWHDDFMVGPGRRSVLRMQGCPIRCQGCWVPETWDKSGGQVISVPTAVAALTDSEYERDGVTILGGEPFAQPFALAQLVRSLKAYGEARSEPTHVTVYTGYMLESLLQADMLRFFAGPGAAESIRYVLDNIDVLIDGPYIRQLAGVAGSWTGSGNQAVHYLRAQRALLT